MAKCALTCIQTAVLRNPQQLALPLLRLCKPPPHLLLLALRCVPGKGCILLRLFHLSLHAPQLQLQLRALLLQRGRGGCRGGAIRSSGCRWCCWAAG